MKGFYPLASGSKGNCIYIGTDSTKILIDAGLSRKAIEQRLSEINVDLSDIDAILVSHEHGDHIRGIDVLGGKMGIPIFANAETAKATCSIVKNRPKFKIFSTGEMFEFGDIQVHPFSVQHDTLDPVAFIIRIHSLKIGVCTDLGFVTSLVKTHLQECDYLYIESNHEPSMVHACPRPMIYKQRVLGRQGHLSNDACAELLEEVQHEHLKRVYLAHLSGECNHEELALSKARNKLPETTEVKIAHQSRVSEGILF